MTPSTEPVAIVTGSSSGVGAATAEQLAARGWNVVGNYSRSAALAEQVLARCLAAGAPHGASALLVQADVAQDADCRRLAEAAMAKWGRIDALANCAGITRFVAHANLEGVDADDFLEVYRVNVVGAFQMSRAVAPAMKAGGRGAVVNISSIAGLKGTGSSIPYAASKSALNTLTESLARVLAPEVRVNAVCPGMIQGRWLQDALGEEKYQAVKKHWEATAPLGKASTPEDVARAVVWFIEGADLVTGQVLVLDSGFTLGPLPGHGR